ncbi:MAG: sigma-70 family RNA polymerase sigma factor [Candidatus Dormibacteraeota bacterium]|nr:sigma-70 family RNA polymerase sigma factor [Candidatus Dormibacteraeota bacterium]
MEQSRDWQDQADEQDLVQRAKHDPAAFAELYERYFLQIYRFVFSRVQDHTVAEDVTSDVFIKALGSIGRYRDRGWPFSAWLYEIATNTVIDRYRTLRPVEDIDGLFGLSDGSSVEDDAGRRDDVRRIGSLIRDLPAQQQTAIVLKFQEDLPIEDIAAVMGKSRGAVKLLIHRAVTNVRRELRGDGLGEAGA